MIAVVVKTTLMLTWAIGFMLPGIHWGQARRRAMIEGRAGPQAATLAGDPLSGALQPMADALRLLSQSDEIPAGASRLAYRTAPIVAFAIPLSVLAIVPFGSHYDLGRFHPNLVIADLDWGVLWLFAAALFSLYGMILAGWASGGSWSGWGAIRAGGELVSVSVPLGLSLVGLFMVFDSLKLSEIVRAQDAQVAIFAFLDRLGVEGWGEGWVEGWGGSLGALRLPAWGIFLQPLGFGLFMAGIALESRRRPFGASASESEIVAGPLTDYSGGRLALFVMASHLWLVVAACLVVSLFLGGWSLPYLSQQRIIASISVYFGEGFATVLCLVLHVLVFLAKVMVVTALWLRLEAVLPRMAEDRIRALCWTTLLPLAFINVLITAAALLWLEGSS